MMLSVALATAILLLLVFFWYVATARMREIAQCIDVLPGDKRYPIIGTSLGFITSTREDLFDKFMAARHQKYGSVYRSWVGSVPMVHISKPEHVQTIFRSNTETYKGAMLKFLQPWLGQGLISGSGPKWKRHRKIITPSFHFKVLDTYSEVFVSKAENFTKYLERFEGAGFFEVTGHLTKLALDIIAETAMGVKVNFLEGNDPRGLEYAQAITDFCSIMYKRLGNPIYSSDFLFGFTELGKQSAQCCRIIHSFNRDVIQTRKKTFKGTSTRDHDDLGMKSKTSFLNMLLQHQVDYAFLDEEIEEEVSTFMFGGMDTTSATLTFAFLALGNHPKVQKAIHQELDGIFEDDPNRSVTVQDLTQMEYLDRFLKEVLRCYCFVPFMYRELQEDLEIAGMKVPKGVTINVSLYDLHHDPEHYPEPFRFDPDRFLPEQCSTRHPYAFAPFSAGPRNCLGQKFAMRNVKTLLANILRRYRIACQEKPEDLRYYLEVVLRPQNGLHIALEPRENRRFG